MEHGIKKQEGRFLEILIASLPASILQSMISSEVKHLNKRELEKQEEDI